MVPSLLALVLLQIVFGLATSTLNSNVCKSPLTAKTTLTSNSQAVNNGEWCGQQGQNNWIEFDFGTYVGIREVVIGKPANSMQGHVTNFNIQFVGTQSQTLQNYGSDPNKAAVIKTGLNDQVGSSKITLSGVAVSKFRINIVNYSKQPCLKIDLHGCTNAEELCPPGCQNGGTCVFEEQCACARGFEGHSCEKAISHAGACMSSLGMANSGIPDSALSVSSSKPGHGKEKARHGCCTGTNGGAWCPAVGDKTPWYEVSFDKPQTVSALDFIYPWYPQGTFATEYMKTFELQFWSALDPVKSWRSFAKDVPSIYNDTLYYTISLQPSIVVNAIRILPLSYKKEPCIRFEVLGCDPKGLCSAGYCLNSGSCMGENICLCTQGYYGARCEHTANELVTLNAGFQTITHQVLQTTTTIKFTVHGNPTLVTTTTGQAIHITSSNQYLVIDKTGFTSCLSDLDKCTNGFTITTNVHFTSTITDNTYIISSGGNLPNTKGIALYYLRGNIHFVVSTSTKIWHLVMPHKLTLNVWHHLELSWNQNLGCELVDNGKLVGSVTQPVPHHATLVQQIAIGHGYTQSATHISMKVEGFKTVDANRASLVVAGIVTPAVSATTHTSPTPTTTVAMTTEEPTTTVTTNQMTTEPTTDSVRWNLTSAAERHDVSCLSDSISVFIPSDLLSHYQTTWRDPHCQVQDNGTHYVSTISHTSCGTTVIFTKDEVIFENELILHKSGSPSNQTSNGSIDFGSSDSEVIPVQCIYPRRQNISTLYRPAQSTVRFYEKRYGHMDVQLEQYKSGMFVTPLPVRSFPNEVEINKDMYFILHAMHVNSTDVAVKVDSCVATPSNMPADGRIYQLLDQGCPASPAVKVYPSAFDEVRFSVRAFEFRTSPGGIVYIHCQVSVCSPTSPQCRVGCAHRHRREVSTEDGGSHLVSGGPYLLVADKGGLQVSTVVAGVCASVAVVATVIAIIGWRRKSSASTSSSKL